MSNLIGPRSERELTLAAVSEYILAASSRETDSKSDFDFDSSFDSEFARAAAALVPVPVLPSTETADSVLDRTQSPRRRRHIVVAAGEPGFELGLSRRLGSVEPQANS